jgi:hypothetical protein
MKHCPERLPPLRNFERRASNPFATQTQGLVYKIRRLNAVNPSKILL